VANEAIERTVEAMIQSGRISRDLRDVYIRDLEANLSNDLLRGADYTNKTQALARERREAEQWLQQERGKVEAERQELRNWHSRANAELQEADRLRSQMNGIAAENAAYRQVLTDYQIMDKVAIPSITDVDPRQPYRAPAPTSQPQVQPQVQPAQNLLTREAAAGALRDFGVLNGKVNRIMAQHQRLFNEPLDEDLFSHFFETGQDPEEYWRVKYNVEGKRNELAGKQREAELAAMKEQIRAELTQQMALDPSRIVGGPNQNRVGGLTPLMENYAQSRATSHGQDSSAQITPPGANDFVPPEKRSDIASSRDRVARATQLFIENYDPIGRPVTDKGKELSRRYSE